jgi:hypothetical protein
MCVMSGLLANPVCPLENRIDQAIKLCCLTIPADSLENLLSCNKSLTEQNRSIKILQFHWDGDNDRWPSVEFEDLSIAMDDIGNNLACQYELYCSISVLW